jgi:hypothetical protein
MVTENTVATSLLPRRDYQRRNTVIVSGAS